MKIVKMLAASLAVQIILIIPVLAQKSVETPASKEDGLIKAIFETPKGNIKVLLPGDMKAGDVISGTVVAEPSGDKPATIEKNRDVLNGYVVGLQGKKTPAGKGRETWSLPGETESPPALVLTLFDPSGKEVAFSALPVDPLERFQNADIYPVTTAIPSYIQSGKAAVVTGLFDGSSENSNVSINGLNTVILAESPGQIIFECPEGVTGQCDIELTEGTTTSRQKINVLDVNMTASNTNLVKGESSEVHVEVTGLNKMKEKVPLTITNFSPANISMKGGDYQTLIIQPDEVSSSGTWSKDLILTGITPGVFSIQARIDTPLSDTIMVKPGFDLKPLMMPEYIEPLMIDPVSQATFAEFARDVALVFNITDFNLPKKYEFDPDKVTVAKSNKGHFNDRRKGANGAAAETKKKTDSTKVADRKDLKGTVGFHVYYTKPDKNNCYWIISEWFSWKSDEYYKNSWKINRELDDVLRFNDIQVDINGDIEMEGTVETGGLDASAEIGIGIPIPGVDAGVSVSYSPPSTAALKAKGTLKGAAKGYLNGKSLVVYIYKDSYHVERAWITYFFRYKQQYCGDSPAGPVIYETTMVDQWEKYTEIKYFADAFLVTEGIPVGPDSVHQRVETLVEDKHVDTDIKDWDKIQPGEDQDPSGFFEGVTP